MLTAQSLGRAVVCALVAGATFGAENAAAQVDYEIMSALQFNFSNPGARSLALAGALTGAGDDATGAWTNPGGLTNISRAEIGFEYRRFNYSTLFVNQGRFDGQVTNIGVDTLPPLIIPASRTTRPTRSRSFRRSSRVRDGRLRSTAPSSRTSRPRFGPKECSSTRTMRHSGCCRSTERSTSRLPTTAARSPCAPPTSSRWALACRSTISRWNRSACAIKRFRAPHQSRGPAGLLLRAPLRYGRNVQSLETIEGDEWALASTSACRSIRAKR